MPIYTQKRFYFAVAFLLIFFIIVCSHRLECAIQQAGKKKTSIHWVKCEDDWIISVKNPNVSNSYQMVFGYAYPAYECFKIVESNKPEIHQLLYWCRYWILVAIITICERFGDCLISWLPMYAEAKLALFVYLWHHKTRGTLYVYESFFLPIVKKHEKEIDNTLLELRVRGGELALVYWEKAATYGHTKFLDILQCASSQSGLRLRSSQQERKVVTYESSDFELNSQQSVTKKLCIETESNSSQEQEPSTEKSTPNKESVQTKHRRFRFFKN